MQSCKQLVYCFFFWLAYYWKLDIKHRNIIILKPVSIISSCRPTDKPPHFECYKLASSSSVYSLIAIIILLVKIHLHLLNKNPTVYGPPQYPFPSVNIGGFLFRDKWWNYENHAIVNCMVTKRLVGRTKKIAYILQEQHCNGIFMHSLSFSCV